MFKIKLSAIAAERLEAEYSELLRLYGLTNQWLGHALLKLARQAQQSRPDLAPPSNCYESVFIYGVIPELCRRLTGVKLKLPEIDWVIREKSNYDLRLLIGYCLQNIAESRLPGWDLISLEAINGNAVVFAIDRLCPGVIGDKADPLVKGISEIAQIRNTPYDGIWRPTLMNYP